MVFNVAMYATYADVIRYEQVLLSQVTSILKLMIEIWNNLLPKKKV